MGLIYLFTFGLFGIGWFIDIIILVTKFISNYTNSRNQNNKTSLENKSTYPLSSYVICPASDFVDDYVVFDFETTGLDPYNDKIIEIGALKYKNNELIASFNKLINPRQDIPKFITELTNISNEDVRNCNYIEDVLPQFINFIGNYTLIAHNNSFDLSFLLYNLKKHKIECIKNKTIDTLSLAREYIPNAKNYKLQTLKELLNIDTISHRAISDCEVTNVVYQYCKKKKIN